MKVVLKHAGKWLHFQNPERVLCAHRIEDVLPMLRTAEASGLFAAGFIAYEAAPAFDTALKTHETDGFPLLCLGLFQAPDLLDCIEEAPASSYTLGSLEPSVSRDAFVNAISRIKERIAEGATYQVNYTYRLHAPFSGDPWALFYDLASDQRTEYAAFIETDQYVVCSASPELFFSFNRGRIIARPMKGTIRRGRSFMEDARQADALRMSEKDRAENIMIVDMIRNDIGRVAEPGSIETVSTYDIEKYPTLWQMTSTVQGKINTEEREGSKEGRQLGGLRDLGVHNISGILKALFPCASITGAPKAKTMEIIRELETSPRRIYTGAIGFISPQGEACFNVAIRTALIDKSTGQLEYGVGGGIVWDSGADGEYEETLTKARVLTEPKPDFKLLETMLWEPEEGVFLLNEHLQRLGKSAAYFDIPLDMHAALRALEETVHTCTGVKHRIRLLVSRDGNSEIQTFPLEEQNRPMPAGGGAQASVPAGGQTSASSAEPRPPLHTGDVLSLRVVLAKEPVNSQDVFLFHKTTHRAVYEQAKAGFPDADDVILWNERDEVTESTIANIVVEKGGRFITPPVHCGLLAGTFREHLLQSAEIEEDVVTVADLKAAERIYLVNSVRKWQRVTLI